MGASNENLRRFTSGLDGLSVLVVEDGYLIAMEMARMLGLLGCEPVGPAQDIEAGLAWLEREKGQLGAALLDINLKGEAVYPLARALVLARVPIVFATGYGLPAIAEEWRDFPMLEKPFHANDLERALMLAMVCPQHLPQPGETYDTTDTVSRAWEAIREGRNAQTEFLIRKQQPTNRVPAIARNAAGESHCRSKA